MSCVVELTLSTEFEAKTRHVVSVSTSGSRDGLETYFHNILVSSRSRKIEGRSPSRITVEVCQPGGKLPLDQMSFRMCNRVSTAEAGRCFSI